MILNLNVYPFVDKKLIVSWSSRFDFDDSDIWCEIGGEGIESLESWLTIMLLLVLWRDEEPNGSAVAEETVSRFTAAIPPWSDDIFWLIESDSFFSGRCSKGVCNWDTITNKL